MRGGQQIHAKQWPQTLDEAAVGAMLIGMTIR